ncbi:MAG: hypothetical protein ACRCTZ_02155 [Sarcina sp.]
MGIGRLYKAQKNKKNVTKGAKELVTVEKLSKKTIEEIDNLLINIGNEKFKDELLSLKAMISLDLSSKNNMGISNYLYGRLYRTHVTSEYSIAKKQYQNELLEQHTSIGKNKELESLFENSKEIFALNIKIARNLLSLTKDYAITNRDLLPKNQKEFDLYMEEYDVYINDRLKDINSKIENIDLNSMKNNIPTEVKTFIDQKLLLQPLEDNIDDLDKYLEELFLYELRLTKIILSLKDLEDKSHELSTFVDVLIEFNKLIIMATLNIFKVTKPFNDKYSTYLGKFDLNEKIKADFEIIKNTANKIM